MDENREALFKEIEAFFDKNGGFPSEWVEEFDNILEDDSFDKLDILVGKLCLDWENIGAVRDFLYGMGGEPDLVESLLADRFDMFF